MLSEERKKEWNEDDGAMERKIEVENKTDGTEAWLKMYLVTMKLKMETLNCHVVEIPTFMDRSQVREEAEQE